MFIDKRSSVMIVSSSKKAAEYLTGVLPKDDYSPVITVESAGDAKRRLVDTPCDIVIINTPLKDDFGLELAVDISEKDASCVALLVKSEYYEQVSYKAEDYGIITVAKPSSTPVILQSVRMLVAMSAKMRRLEKKASTLEMKMEEIRLVNRAKLLLIEQLKMSEAQAHRYIEKAAMDNCVKRREIAENIIRIYES